jgi:hypothetical protein
MESCATSLQPYFTHMGGGVLGIVILHVMVRQPYGFPFCFLKLVWYSNFYVPASYILYLSDLCRFLLCTCGWERRGRGGAGEGEGARKRGIECILYGYT